MQRYWRPVGLLIIVVLGGGCGACPRCGESVPLDGERAEAEIWELEDAYWRFNRDADHEGIIGTWHDEFLGWPASEPEPIDKEEGVRFVRENYAEPASYDFRIEPTGIVVHGCVAVNHYTVHLTEEDPEGESRTRSLRITHTWLHDAEGWRVLGGMSCLP